MAKVRCMNCGRKVKLDADELGAISQAEARAQARIRILFYIVAAGVGAAIAWAAAVHWPHKTLLSPAGSSDQTLGQIIFTPDNDIGQYDIAAMNLVCTKGLPGAEDLNIEQCLAVLDDWAGQVKLATAERRFIYDKDPQKWGNSENWWRMSFLVGYLSRVIGIEYSKELKNMPRPVNKFDTRFFANSKDVFIHGLLTGKKQGTCSSMPVLVACVGRRMGYPLKLARTRHHLFVRWADPKTGEQFNVEVTDKNAEKKTDEFYMTWPDRLEPAEIKRNGYLSNLAPAQELSIFLGFRGLCLWHAGRLPEAQMAFSVSHRFDPMSPGIPEYVTTILIQEWEQGVQNGYKSADSNPW